MKNQLLFLFVLLVLAAGFGCSDDCPVCPTSQPAAEKEYYFYDQAGARVPLNFCDTFISIAGPKGDVLDSILAAEPGLANNEHLVPLPDGFLLLKFDHRYPIEPVVKRLRERLSPSSVNNLFERPGGYLLYLTSSFACEFQLWVPQSAIDSVNKVHGVVIKDTLFKDRGRLILGLTPSSELDVLAMGNLYFESGLARYSRANVGVIGIRLTS